MKVVLPFLLAALPVLAAAQSRPADAASVPPHGAVVVADSAAAPNPEATQQHLLASDVVIARLRAAQLPDLYERFIGTTRDERRTWAYAQWEAAAQVLARLNQRYEQVRADLPLEERLRIRAFQGEFHALRGARGR